MTTVQRESRLYIDGRWTPGSGADLEVESLAAASW